MPYLQAAVPLLVFAAIVALVLKSALRGRFARARTVRTAPRPRTPAPRTTTLRDVSRDQMDDDLKDLLRRRP